MKKAFAPLALLTASLLLAACGNNPAPSSEAISSIEPVPVVKTDSSETLYVKKIANLPDDFIFGMDSSQVISLEQAGVKYYDFDGQEKDVFQILAQNGINSIRVRVWNDPYDASGNGYGGGNCDLAKAIEIGRRATRYGMGLHVDFHYSDFWADPAKQSAPKAWKGLELDDMKVKLYEFTRDSLNAIRKEGIKVNMVQVGNETNGYAMCGFKDPVSFVTLFNEGSKAVREVFPDALVACHFANPEKNQNYANWARALNNYGADYDVFGSSYYPYWHGTLDNLATTLSAIATTYNKKVMVMETSYCFDEEDTDFGGNTISSHLAEYPYPFSDAGQANHIWNLTDTLVNHTTNAIGIAYWEGTWISTGGSNYDENHLMWERYGTGWASSYAAEYDKDVRTYGGGGGQVDNQAFFDAHGHVREPMKVFALMKEGNQDVPKYVDAAESLELIHYTTDNFALPETVNVIYNDNSKSPVPVTWDAFDIEAAKARGNADYDIHGVASGFEVTLTLHMLEYNFVENYSFEDGLDPWVRNVIHGTLADDYVVKITNENPKTGTYAFHLWSNSADNALFEIEQEILIEHGGAYKFQYSLLGGAASSPADPSKQNIYGYVKLGDEILGQADGKFTTYNDGYASFKAEDIIIPEGSRVKVGIHVEANEAKSWCDIDDVMLNFVSAVA